MKQFIKIPEVEVDNGKATINVSSDLGNDDWMATSRMMKAGKSKQVKKRFETSMYKIVEIKE